MQGRREFFESWARRTVRGLGGAAIAALAAATITAAACGQAWWPAALAAAFALLAWRAAEAACALHLRAERLHDEHVARLHHEAMLRNLDVQVLRQQATDLQNAERRALKLARRQLDAAMRDCRRVHDEPGLSPNAVLAELEKARFKVTAVLAPPQADSFAQLTQRYAQMLRPDPAGGVSEDSLTHDQAATVRRATVAPSIDWLSETLRTLDTQDLNPALRS